MIKDIFVVPRVYVEKIIQHKEKLPTDNYYYLISIYGDDRRVVTAESKKILETLNFKNFLSLEFWDITDKDYGPIKEKFPQAELFHVDQAKKIIQFLERIKHQEDGTLIVHCTAGISRSGAVGTFACDYFGLNYLEFKRNNPYILPNPYVLRLLNNEWSNRTIDIHSLPRGVA